MTSKPTSETVSELGRTGLRPKCDKALAWVLKGCAATEAWGLAWTTRVCKMIAFWVSFQELQR